MSPKVLLILIAGALLIGVACSLLFPVPYSSILSMLGGGIYGHFVGKYRDRLS